MNGLFIYLFDSFILTILIFNFIIFVIYLFICLLFKRVIDILKEKILFGKLINLEERLDLFLSL